MRFLSDLRGTLQSVFNIKPSVSSGAPSSGTYKKGDVYMDSNGVLWRCTASGTPGTWYEVGSSILEGERNDPTGFVSRTTSTLSFNTGTREVTISPTGTNFSFYSAGVKYTKTAQTKQIDDTNGLHYVYFDTSGVIQKTTDPWDISSAAVPVACVYWNGTAGILYDERHGIQMDGMTQEYLHETRGSAFASGMAGTFAANGSTITIGAGEWYDEDIEHIIVEQTTCRIFYLLSTTWNWTSAQAPYYHVVSSAPQYNNSGALANVDTAKYSVSWVYMTNATSTPVAVIMGQAQYNTQALAEAATLPNLSTLPGPEMILLYRVIWQRDGAVISWKRTDDYRRVLSGPASGYIATDHGALAGLNDSDHPASAIIVDASGFSGNLSATDTNVQTALSTIDTMGATDENAIHDNVNGEINAITAKDTPLGGDMAVIEDAGATYAKKKVDLSNWPLWGFRLYTSYGAGIYTGTTYIPKLYYDESDDEIRWDLVTGLPYTPAVLTDWNSDADPGDIDDALDQLAARVDDIEGGSGHAAVTLDSDAAVLLDLSSQEIGLDVQNANKVFAGPSTGADNEPTFRALVAADLGTGTPNNTKFLRDDLSWQAVASGAPTGAAYVTSDAHADLSAEIVIPSFAGHPDRKPASPTSYDDEFDSSSLDAKWTLTDASGITDVDTSVPSHWVAKMTGNQSANISQTYQPGAVAFSVTAKLHALVRGNYDQAFVEIYDSDESDGVIAGIQWSSSPLWTMAKKVSGTWTYSISQMNSVPNSGTHYIHLKRDSGSTWQFFTSNDGISWSKIGNSQTITFTVDHVEITLNNGGQTIPNRRSCDWIRWDWITLP